MREKLQEFKNALSRFAEIMQMEKNDVTRDSAIMRFQFCYDLAWKTIKSYLRTQGIECFSPKECFRGAFGAKLIDENKLWFSMIDDRNNITHVYAEKMAEKVYSHLTNYLKLLQQLLAKLNSASIHDLTKL